MKEKIMIVAIGWITVYSVLGAVLVSPVVGETLDGRAGLHPRVRMETTLGTIVLELDGEKAPRTANSFVSYVEDRFYDGTIFHRVLADGLIQGGAYIPTLDRRTDGLRTGVKSEWDNGLSNLRGTIAIYRRAGFVDSAKAEFFISTRDNPGLDRQHRDGAAYTVFGRVVDGMDTIDRIAATPVDTHPKYARGRSKVVPIDPVVIKSVRMLSEFDHKKALTIAEDAEIRKEKAAEYADQAQIRQVSERIKEIEARSGQEMTTTQSGLNYIVLRLGTGAPPIESETVTVAYEGTLADGKVFVNTYLSETAKPITKRVSKFIEGLREGILDMNEGGKRFFVIPPEIGFKNVGVPGRIPADATLFFELELLSIEND